MAGFMWWTIIHIIIRPGSSITVIFLTVQLKKKKNPNSKLIITVTFFLTFFPWSICINNQFKKGKTILLSNNLSSVLFFWFFWALSLIYVQLKKYKPKFCFHIRIGWWPKTTSIVVRGESRVSVAAFLPHSQGVSLRGSSPPIWYPRIPHFSLYCKWFFNRFNKIKFSNLDEI